MEKITEYIYIILLVSVCTGISVYLSSSTNGLNKYVKFISSITLIAMLAYPAIGISCELIKIGDIFPSIDSEERPESENIIAVVNIYKRATEDTVKNIIYDIDKTEAEIEAQLISDGKNITVEKIKIYSSKKISDKVISEIQRIFSCSNIIQDGG